MSTSGADSSAGTSARPRPSAAQLLAAKNTRPIKSIDGRAADIFGSDEELEVFLALSYAHRHRDPCLTARGAAAHPLLDTGLASPRYGTGGSSPGRWPRA